MTKNLSIFHKMFIISPSKLLKFGHILTGIYNISTQHIISLITSALCTEFKFLEVYISKFIFLVLSCCKLKLVYASLCLTSGLFGRCFLLVRWIVLVVTIELCTASFWFCLNVLSWIHFRSLGSECSSFPVTCGWQMRILWIIQLSLIGATCSNTRWRSFTSEKHEKKNEVLGCKYHTISPFHRAHR